MTITPTTPSDHADYPDADENAPQGKTIGVEYKLLNRRVRIVRELSTGLVHVHVRRLLPSDLRQGVQQQLPPDTQQVVGATVQNHLETSGILHTHTVYHEEVYGCLGESIQQLFAPVELPLAQPAYVRKLRFGAAA